MKQRNEKIELQRERAALWQERQDKEKELKQLEHKMRIVRMVWISVSYSQKPDQRVSGAGPVVSCGGICPYNLYSMLHTFITDLLGLSYVCFCS